MDDASQIERQLRSQQRALASFGEFTLKNDDLDEILTEACRLVAETLQADFSKVMELQPDGETLMVRAGVGWEPGVVAKATVRAAEGTSEHFTFHAGQPVTSANVEDEDRFIYPEFMRRHGVKAFVNVPIVGPNGAEAYGILEVDSRTPRDFSEHDISFMRTYANLLAATVMRLQAIARLKKAILDKDRLFTEAQHRTKNNLQLISSFVRLRLKRAASDDAKEQLLGLSSRIETIHLLHEKLYSTGDLDSIDLAAYLGDLAGTLLSVQPGSAPVHLQMSIQKVVVTPEVAVPIGLILNEFMTNSMKYAFDDRGGVIGVELMSADGEASLRIWDNGKGLPDQPDASGGTGISLINALARQINARPTWSSEGGTTVILTFWA